MIIKARRGKINHSGLCEVGTEKSISFEHWQVWDCVGTYHLNIPINPKTSIDNTTTTISFNSSMGDITLFVYDFEEFYIMNNDGKTIETLRNIHE